MINITLICAAGMSTSMLMMKMRDSAKKKGVETNIIAMSETSFETYEGKTDVLLIAPQISFLEDEIRARYESSGMKISLIQMVDYGMMNGEKVLDTALSELNK